MAPSVHDSADDPVDVDAAELRDVDAAEHQGDAAELRDVDAAELRRGLLALRLTDPTVSSPVCVDDVKKLAHHRSRILARAIVGREEKAII